MKRAPNVSRIDSVLLVSFGGPERREDVIPFLQNVLHGIPVSRARMDEVASHYYHFGGRSPINEHTFAQARALAATLRDDGLNVPVVVGNRHWKPFTFDAMRELAASGAKRTAGIVLAGHRSGAASYDKYVLAVEIARATFGNTSPEVTYTESFHAAAGFVDAVVARIEEADPGLHLLHDEGATLLFTAHSIPVAAAGSSPYVGQLEESCRAVAARVGPARWRLVYQSRSGRASDPWLEPDISDALREESAGGIQTVVVVPIGFLSDHMEVLYDLDVEAARTAKSLGIRFIRARTVLDHPRFIRALADAVLALS